MSEQVSSSHLALRTKADDATPPSREFEELMAAWRIAVAGTIAPTARAALRAPPLKKQRSRVERATDLQRLPSVVCSRDGQLAVVEAMMGMLHAAVHATLCTHSTTHSPSGSDTAAAEDAAESTPRPHLPRPSLLLDQCDTSKLPAVPSEAYQRTVGGRNVTALPPFGRHGIDPSILFVQQGEYGFLASNGITARSEEHTPPAAWIASVDATSCVVVGVRCHMTGRSEEVIGVGHFDSAGPAMIASLHDLLHNMVFHALLATLPPCSAMQDGGAATQDVVEVEWYVAGGMKDRENALPVLADLSYFLTHELTSAVALRSAGSGDTEQATALRSMRLLQILRLDSVCVWDMNATEHALCYEVVLRCCVWGLQIAFGASGLCQPCHIVPESRTYPAAALRDIPSGYRRISPSAADDVQVDVFRTHPPGENTDRLIGWPLPLDGAATTGDAAAARPGKDLFASFVKHSVMAIADAMQGHSDTQQRHRLPFLIDVASWTPLARSAAQRTAKMADEEFLQWSTTPHCEPPDFPYCVRRKRILQSLVTPAMVFGSAAEVIGPLVLMV